MRKLAVLLLLLSSACATLAGPEEDPYAEVLVKLCEIFRLEEDLRPHQEVIVLSQTQPIYQMFALHVVERSEDLPPTVADEDEVLSNRYRAQHKPEKIAISGGFSCNWIVKDEPLSSGEDRLLLELSNIVPNPFGEQGASGLFAKLSYGGRDGAAWYWVALARQGNEWNLEEVIPLPIFDG